MNTPASRPRMQVCLLLLALVIATSAHAQQFFPTGVFYPDNLKLDSAVSRWYSEHLSALREPSLFQEKDSNVQIYRFLWLRTFHHPVAVRVIILSDGSATVMTKMADGTGGYKPGKLILDKTEALVPEKAQILSEKVRRLLYAPVPLRVQENNGRDGAQWILEGMDHGRYRLIERWRPQDGPVRDLGLYFLRDLGRLDLKPDEIY